MTAEERAAVAAFPELRRLLALRDAGWQFQHTGRQVRAVRTWPGGWADAVAVAYVSDAFALRVGPDGITWRRTGGLVDVVDALVELPAPGEPFAPRLALGAVPPLWTP